MNLPSLVAVQQEDGSWCVYDQNIHDQIPNADDFEVGVGDSREDAIADYVEALEFDTSGLVTNMIHACVVAILEKRL